MIGNQKKKKNYVSTRLVKYTYGMHFYCVFLVNSKYNNLYFYYFYNFNYNLNL